MSERSTLLDAAMLRTYRTGAIDCMDAHCYSLITRYEVATTDGEILRPMTRLNTCMMRIVSHARYRQRTSQN